MRIESLTHQFFLLSTNTVRLRSSLNTMYDQDERFYYFRFIIFV